MFRQLLRLDKEEMAGHRRGRKVTVRRDSVLEDAYRQLGCLGASIKESLMVMFIDEHGTQEAGVFRISGNLYSFRSSLESLQDIDSCCADLKC